MFSGNYRSSFKIDTVIGRFEVLQFHQIGNDLEGFEFQRVGQVFDHCLIQEVDSFIRSSRLAWCRLLPAPGVPRRPPGKRRLGFRLPRVS